MAVVQLILAFVAAGFAFALAASANSGRMASFVAAAGTLLVVSPFLGWVEFGDTAWKLGQIVPPDVYVDAANGDGRPFFVGTNGLWLHTATGTAMLVLGLTGHPSAGPLGAFLAFVPAAMAVPDLVTLFTVDTASMVAFGDVPIGTYSSELRNAPVAPGAGLYATVLAGVIPLGNLVFGGVMSPAGAIDGDAGVDKDV